MARIHRPKPRIRTPLCSATNAQGLPCQAYSLQPDDPRVAGLDEPRCLVHALGPEKWAEVSARGIAKSAEVRSEKARARKKGKPTHEADQATIKAASDTIAKLLAAKLPNGEPDMVKRGWGTQLAATVLNFDTEQTIAHLESALQRTFPEWHRQRLLEEASKSRQRVRELYEAGRIPLELIPPGILSHRELESFGVSPEDVKPFVPAATVYARTARAKAATS